MKLAINNILVLLLAPIFLVGYIWRIITTWFSAGEDAAMSMELWGEKK